MRGEPRTAEGVYANGIYGFSFFYFSTVTRITSARTHTTLQQSADDEASTTGNGKKSHNDVTAFGESYWRGAMGGGGCVQVDGSGLTVAWAQKSIVFICGVAPRKLKLPATRDFHDGMQCVGEQWVSCGASTQRILVLCWENALRVFTLLKSLAWAL